MKPIAPTQQELAAALGVHASVVTRDKGRGMPVDSIEAARAWRREHVRPRAGGRPARACSDELADLECLWPLARAALEAGRFEVVRPALQRALHAIPAEARNLVRVDVDVMKALCSEFLALLRHERALQGPMEMEMTDGEADAMARVWYCIAAGESFPVAWLEEGSSGCQREPSRLAHTKERD